MQHSQRTSALVHGNVPLSNSIYPRGFSSAVKVMVIDETEVATSSLETSSQPGRRFQVALLKCSFIDGKAPVLYPSRSTSTVIAIRSVDD